MASWMKMIALFSLVLLFFCSSNAQSCVGPTVEATSFTSTDANLAMETTFLVEFTLTCKNAAKDLVLHADIGDRQFPVSRSADGIHYQVSWTEEHKEAPAGSYDIRFFDDEGFSALRKAQRSDQDVSAVSSLFTITVHHRGVSQGPWVSSPTVAAISAFAVWLFAYRAKRQIQD
ncbi:SSR4 [Branchiostoma lanceolatum]|uniref:Translocon-associated protein subunit delta n=1 Tax=Branchiostoma lanceolatum TaxID=7740 RepID=A0A8K0ETQ4_BRALA|nr:SSR4 [Branchiostoma lanceolatum]